MDSDRLLHREHELRAAVRRRVALSLLVRSQIDALQAVPRGGGYHGTSACKWPRAGGTAGHFRHVRVDDEHRGVPQQHPDGSRAQDGARECPHPRRATVRIRAEGSRADRLTCTLMKSTETRRSSGVSSCPASTLERIALGTYLRGLPSSTW